MPGGMPGGTSTRARRRTLRTCGGPSSLRLTEAHRAAEACRVCRAGCQVECPEVCREAWVACPTWETLEAHPRAEETTPDPRSMRWINLDYCRNTFYFVTRMMMYQRTAVYTTIITYLHDELMFVCF